MPATLVQQRVFGKDSRPTVYYFTGYGATIKQFRLHIWFLQLLGYRVVAFQVDRRVLSDGDPALLGTALEEVMPAVKQDILGRRVAGAYGISLGSFFALNVLTLPEVDRAFLCTGGGSIVRAVWDMAVLKPVKDACIKNGYDREGVGKFWNPIDISCNIERISGKTLMAVASEADEYIPFEDVHDLSVDWQKTGVKAELLISHRLRHVQLIIRTLLRLRRTKRFFA